MDEVLEKGVLIDDYLWFDLLQDEGFTETKKQQDKGEKVKQTTMKKKSDKPTKPKHISCNKKLHPKLYTLAMEVVKVARSMDIDAFPRLPDKTTTNISKTYHAIGEWVATRRTLYKRADIHNIGSGNELVMEIMNNAEYRATGQFYVLDQNDVFKYLFQKFGPKESTTTEFVVDDYIRVMGVIFNDEVLRVYLPDMIGRTKNGTCNEIYGNRPGARSGFRQLWDRFKDEEVVVTLPSEWGTAESIKRLEGRAKYGVVGVYEKYGRFNPNNLEWIALPWLEKEVIALFGYVMTLYNQCMAFYTMGMGGGAGHPENYTNWQHRDSEWVAAYLNEQDVNLFLAPIHMWDKFYSFPLVKVVGSVPSEAQIDDDIFDADAAGSDGEFNIHYDPTTPARRTAGLDNRSSSGCKRSDSISAAIRSMESQRQVVATNSSEMAASMQSLVKIASSNSSTRPDTPVSTDNIIKEINETEDTVVRFKAKLKKLKKKRNKASGNPKKLACIDSEIKRARDIVHGLNLKMDQHASKLRKTSSGAAVEELGTGDDDISSDSESTVDGGESDSSGSE